MSGSKGQAAELVETMLTFIEQVSNRKLRFSSIVDLNTGKTSDPTDRLVFAIDAALRAAKVEGLREAGDLHEQVNTYCDHEPKAGAGGMGVAIRYRDLIRQRAAKLAQQAQEGGVGDAGR